MTEMHGPERNWAGNYTYRAQKLHRPTTMEQVQEIVANAASVHVLGSRHSFNDIADSWELISLENLPADVVVDHEAQRVSFGGGVKYGNLVKTLNDEGVALHTLASLPHISVAGAVATATHGSGVTCGNLGTAVAGLEIITSSGEIIKASRGDPDFDGLVVGLGALGAVTRITLDVQPAYEVKQRVFEGLSWKALYDHFDEITSCGYSVSIFTRWGETNDQVWVKSRTDEPDRVEGDLFGAVAATVDRHPIVELDPTPCTPQLGRPGLWFDRLPHFRMGYSPSSGEEIQSVCHGSHRSRARPRRWDPTHPAGERDSPGGRGSAVDEHELRGRLRRHPHHLETRARRGPGDGRPDRGCPDPVRGAPALGQGLPCGRSGTRSALQAPF